MPTAPPAFTVAFAALSLVTAGTWLFLFRRAHVDGRASALLIAWIALTGGLAAAGVLAVFAPFPRLMPLFVVGLLGVGVLAFGRAGGRLVEALPVAALVGLQLFRLPVELLLHWGASEGVLPPLMTWSGRNLDILTPALALPLAVLAARGAAPRWALHAFNLLGVALVVNVAAHGVMAMPTPFQVFDTTPPNVWIADWPFVWLPTLLVPTALALHGLLARTLASEVRVGPR